MEDSNIDNNDTIIREKLNLNKEISREIRDLNEKIKVLKNEQKMNNIFIFNTCEHKWVLDISYFQYDERPNRCTKCNLVKN